MKNVDLVKILDVLLYMCSDLYVYSQLYLFGSTLIWQI